MRNLVVIAFLISAGSCTQVDTEDGVLDGVGEICDTTSSHEQSDGTDVEVCDQETDSSLPPPVSGWVYKYYCSTGCFATEAAGKDFCKRQIGPGYLAYSYSCTSSTGTSCGSAGWPRRIRCGFFWN